MSEKKVNKMCQTEHHYTFFIVCFRLKMTSHCSVLSHSWAGLKHLDSRSWIWRVFDKAHFDSSSGTTVWRNLPITNYRAPSRHTPHSIPPTKSVISTESEHEQNAMFSWKQTPLCAHYLGLISLFVCLCLRFCFPSFIAACLPDSSF